MRPGAPWVWLSLPAASPKAVVSCGMTFATRPTDLSLLTLSTPLLTTVIQGGDFTMGNGMGGERYVEPGEAVPHSEPALSTAALPAGLLIADDAAPSAPCPLHQHLRRQVRGRELQGQWQQLVQPQNGWQQRAIGARGLTSCTLPSLGMPPSADQAHGAGLPLHGQRGPGHQRQPVLHHHRSVPPRTCSSKALS